MGVHSITLMVGHMIPNKDSFVPNANMVCSHAMYPSTIFALKKGPLKWHNNFKAGDRASFKKKLETWYSNLFPAGVITGSFNKSLRSFLLSNPQFGLLE